MNDTLYLVLYFVFWFLMGAGGTLLALALLLIVVYLVAKTATLAVLWGKLKFYQRQQKEMEKDGKPGKT